MPWWLMLIIIISGVTVLWLIIHIVRIIAANNVKVKPYVSGWKTTFPDIEDGHVKPKRQRYTYKYDKDFDFRYKKGMRKFIRFLVRETLIK